MEWSISVSPKAREAILEFDPTLMEEFIKRISELAESPASMLTRSNVFPGALVFAYRSLVDPFLEIRAVFEGFDHGPQHLNMLTVVRVAHPPGTEP